MKTHAKTVGALLLLIAPFIPIDAAMRTRSAVFPVVGTTAGANGTQFNTELTFLNLSGADASVTLDFYASGFSANAAPSTSRTILLAADEQLIASMQQLDLPEGTGALWLHSTQPIIAMARIFNRPSASSGTNGQFVPAFDESESRTNGALPRLSNVHPQFRSGFRSNIGWFNPGDSPVEVTFRFHRFGGAGPGTVEGTVTRSIAPRSQLQGTLNDLLSYLEPEQQLYVTFETEGGPLFVYASVVDNITGDAIFVPAQ